MSLKDRLGDVVAIAIIFGVPAILIVVSIIVVTLTVKWVWSW